jgi:beta-glucosidase
MPFPKGFVWGAATAAYQVEGATREDGRGPCVWDMLCRMPGRIWQGCTGDVACDHYHRWREDVALMREMGLGGYRFSVAWPRVLPSGVGAVNEPGLAFYDRLVDELLAAGIQPFVTLFHWDYPYELFCRGGWLNRDSAAWFADYAALLAQRLGDRVGHWMTFNEPQCFVGLGHVDGIHAPGIKLGQAEALRMVHHVLLAHGAAAQALRANSRGPCAVGIAPVCHAAMPASDSAADLEAAHRFTFGVEGRKDVWSLGWWLEPLASGRYPEEASRAFAGRMPEIRPGDMERIAQPLDFIGANVYQADSVVRATAAGPGWERVPSLYSPVDRPLTALRWTVAPEGLYWIMRFLHERYRRPLYVTENGLSNVDWVARDGAVHDPQRIDFTARYLVELRRAIEGGADVRGYFHWSLMDNFEWAEGFKERFGLVYVDYATGRRTPKDSARWYKETIAANGTNL